MNMNNISKFLHSFSQASDNNTTEVLGFCTGEDAKTFHVVSKTSTNISKYTEVELKSIEKEYYHKRFNTLRIEGDAPNMQLGCDKVLEAAGYTHVGESLNQRKVWEKNLLT